jgi:hypothetical protein
MPDIQISIETDIRAVAMMLDRARKVAVPAASRMAVNDLAFRIMRAERRAAGTVFEHPRPFTQNAFLVRQAARGSGGEAAALVYTRLEAEKYLMPYEFGGDHVLPGEALLVPVDMRTDAYGQIPKGAIGRLKARKDVFVGKVGSVMGFWQRIPVKGLTKEGHVKRGKGAGKQPVNKRTGKRYRTILKLLIRFGNVEPVKKHLNFETRAKAIIEENFQHVFATALRKALGA